METKSAAVAGGQLGAEEKKILQAGALGSGVKTCGRNRAESRLNQYRSEGQTHKSSFHTSQHFYLICCQLRDELWRKGGMRNERSSTVVKSKHAEKKKSL